MRTRIISGVIGAAALIAALLSGRFYLNIGVALISFIAFIELYKAVGLPDYLPLKITGLTTSFAFIFAYSFGLLTPMLYIYIVILFGLYMFQGKIILLQDISKMFFITISIPFLLGHLVLIRKLEMGQFYIWAVFIGAFLTDTFALLFGKLFGRHKLCPHLSPKKTIEGAIGGVIGSCGGMVLYGCILQNFFGFEVDYPLLFLLGVLSSVSAQFGDLAASRIKRQYEIKDYGRIIPGHGGIMDRFDSVLFTAPLVYIFISSFAIIH